MLVAPVGHDLIQVNQQCAPVLIFARHLDISLRLFRLRAAFRSAGPWLLFMLNRGLRRRRCGRSVRDDRVERDDEFQVRAGLLYLKRGGLERRGYEYGSSARVRQDVLYLIVDLGRIDREVDRSNGEGSQIGAIPFGAILGPDGNAVTGSESQAVKSHCEVPHSIGDIEIGEPLPLAFFLELQELAAPVSVNRLLEQLV